MYDVFNLTEAKEGVKEDPCSQMCECYRQLNFSLLVVDKGAPSSLPKQIFPDMMFFV